MLQRLADAVRAAVDRVKQDAVAAKTLAEWIGDGGDPVVPALAERRAAICAQCPQNVIRRKRLETSIAEAIRQQESLRSQIDLRTGNDANLHTCQSCGCHLKLKVWVPLKHLQPAEFPPTCWYVTESAAPEPAPEPAPVHVAKPERPTVSIRRMDALGDVILASILATKMHALGYDVNFACSAGARHPLNNHPHVAGFITDGRKTTVELDKTYEKSPDRNKKDIGLLMLEAASEQLRAGGFPVPDFHNRVPNLFLMEQEIMAMRDQLSRYPKPWVAMVPKSGSWPNRAVKLDSLSTAAGLINGSCVWAFQGDATANILPVQIRSFRDLMALIYLSDLVVTPDTGPLHVAAAFNKRVVVLETCNDTQLRLTELTDYSTASAPLSCIRCGEFHCPINQQDPPCQAIPGHAIATAVNERLTSHSNGKVSAIIPVYKVDARLDRCIAAVRDQVDEVIVAFDGTAGFVGMRPGVRVVPPTGFRTGYGKTCMRGARVATGEHLLMLNDDCYMNAGSVGAMRAAMHDPKVAVVGAQLWYPDGTIQHGGMGRNTGDIGFGHIDHRRRAVSITALTELECVTFASALVRRSAFYGVRGFDEEYDCYAEDTDLCMKVRRDGWKVMYEPTAVGIHDESQTTSPMKAKLATDAMKIFVRKWRRYFEHNPPTR